jgi:hypothetical protein
MNAFYVILAACPVILLGAIAFLVMIVIGVRKGDRGERLTGEPGNAVEALARRVLTGSRDFDSHDEGTE